MTLRVCGSFLLHFYLFYRSVYFFQILFYMCRRLQPDCNVQIHSQSAVNNHNCRTAVCEHWSCERGTVGLQCPSIIGRVGQHVAPVVDHTTMESIQTVLLLMLVAFTLCSDATSEPQHPRPPPVGLL